MSTSDKSIDREEGDRTTRRTAFAADVEARTGIDEAMIHLLVHTFYQRIRTDPVLGPVFEARITDWPPHLARMCAFWSSVVLMTGRYHGRPMQAHAPLPVDAQHFDRWLALFEATARDVCPLAAAALFIEKARMIAQSLELGIATQRGLLLAPGERLPSAFTQPIAQSGRKGWAAMTDTVPLHDAAALTHHIETRYHARHREQLPALVELAAKVESVHVGVAGVPAGLSGLLRRMIGELEVHMKKEELILFPAMRKGGGPGIEHPISVMRADHDGHDREVAEIRRLTGGPNLPEGACRSWTALYAELDEFLSDLAEHMRLENEVLFPMFEASGRPSN